MSRLARFMVIPLDILWWRWWWSSLIIITSKTTNFFHHFHILFIVSVCFWLFSIPLNLNFLPEFVFFCTIPDVCHVLDFGVNYFLCVYVLSPSYKKTYKLFQQIHKMILYLWRWFCQTSQPHSLTIQLFAWSTENILREYLISLNFLIHHRFSI